MKKTIFVLVLIFFVSEVGQAQTTYQEWYQEAVIAYQKKDFSKALEAFKKADELRPNHRVIAYNLAATYTLNGLYEEAISVLQKRAGYYALTDFEGDSIFIPLKKSGSYKELLKKIEKRRKPIHTSEELFRVNDPGFHPEGILIDEKNNRVILGDIRTGAIYSFDYNGNDRKLLLDLTEYGYWSAMGMSFDKNQEDLVWIATSAMTIFTNYEPEQEGKSAVIGYNLVENKIVHSFQKEGSHLFGDLITDKKGYVWVTDSVNPAIFRIDPQANKMVEMFKSEQWWSLQGLAFSERGDILYASDYLTGVYSIDMESGTISSILSENEKTRGSDGIYLIGDRLFMLQNGTNPMRLSSIKVDNAGKAYKKTWKVLENNLGELNEPTLGTVVNGELYYIANSPWQYYENDQPKLENWPEIRVWKISPEKQK